MNLCLRSSGPCSHTFSGIALVLLFLSALAGFAATQTLEVGYEGQEIEMEVVPGRPGTSGEAFPGVHDATLGRGLPSPVPRVVPALPRPASEPSGLRQGVPWTTSRKDGLGLPGGGVATTGPDISAGLAGTGRMILENITFDYRSSVFLPSSMGTLQAILVFMRSHPGRKLIVEGHTDSVGPDDGNLRLSQERAEAVRDWLVSHGASPANLQAQGLGETRPIADNASPEGQARNRRVELVVAP